MVSVIIPYFNRGSTLQRALDSVKAQTYQDFEIVVVNDGSTDQSERIVEDYRRNHPELSLKHLSQANTGPSGARNLGIRHAEGDYIAFLDSDDSWEPKNLEIQMDYLTKNLEVAITGTNFYIIKDHKWNRYPLEPVLIEANFYRMLFKVLFSMSSVVVRREVFFRDNIWFREGKNQAEDLLLFLQIIRRYRGVRFSIPLANVYKLEYGEAGLTSDLSKLLKNELENLSILYSENKGSTKKISLGLVYLLKIYSHLKHGKRVLRSNWYKWCRMGS